MTAVVRSWSGRQVMVQVGVTRAGDVPVFVGGGASAGLRESETAVDHDPIGFAKTLGQRVGVY